MQFMQLYTIFPKPSLIFKSVRSYL